MTPDQQDLARKEGGRWTALSAIDAGGHMGATEDMIMAAIVPSWLGVHRDWLRDQLHYLESRDLIEIERHEIKPWRATLTRHGKDIVDYVVDCEPGISRPRKYWGDGAA